MKVRSRGFSLIEVIVVLAIIGLIFVIIFLAVGANQRAQRDTARKDSLNRLVIIFKQMGGNNSGVYPTCAPGPSCTPPDGWLPSDNLTMTISNASGAVSTSNFVWLTGSTDAVGAWTSWCGEVSNASTGSTHHIVNGAVEIQLEAGGTYCAAY